MDYEAPLVWTVDGLVSAEECRALISRIDESGPSLAPITTGRGFVLDVSLRNNTRAIFDDAPLAQSMFERVAPYLPQTICGGTKLVGANERWRCYRYDEGQFFAPHYDGAFVRGPSEMSRLTFLIYLNDGFEGGETDFPELGAAVSPKAGLMVLFQHRLLHESKPLRRGRKYVARSDIMYGR